MFILSILSILSIMPILSILSILSHPIHLSVHLKSSYPSIWIFCPSSILNMLELTYRAGSRDAIASKKKNRFKIFMFLCQYAIIDNVIFWYANLGAWCEIQPLFWIMWDLKYWRFLPKIMHDNIGGRLGCLRGILWRNKIDLLTASDLHLFQTMGHMNSSKL